MEDVPVDRVALDCTAKELFTSSYDVEFQRCAAGIEYEDTYDRFPSQRIITGLRALREEVAVADVATAADPEEQVRRAPELDGALALTAVGVHIACRNPARSQLRR